MGGTRFMVQWEEHPSHLATRLGQLLEHQTLVDVTLMCNTHTLRVHRAVLAACSPYFETILQRQLGMYPLIVLKDMQFSVLKSLIEFMYCGETSVTEDNLSALLQAAKFFQVKGLSAMTKEALGLTSPATPKTTTTVNGEAARKAFVGRSKRVGMQQTFVASGLKSVTPSSSHVHAPGSDVHTPTTGKTIFQTTPKSVSVRQDTHQQQQQTDTAQLLLSLSGSEFPKQTFHTVSKNVRFHHGASSGNVTVEPSRTCSLESSIVKNKEPTVRSEVIDRVPVVTSDGGMKSASVILPTQLVEKGLEQQIIPEKTVEGTKDDVTSQMFYVEDGPCKRGRPLKRQMNLVFQEKVLTDAEMALQKEAEASRKALEMLQQEMSTGDETPSTVVTQPAESVQQKIVPVKQPVTKAQPSQQVNNMITTSRILSKDPTVASKLATQKTNIVTQATAVNTSETSSQNVIYQVSGNTIPAIDSNSNETNIVYQLQEGQNSGNTNIVYQVADNALLAGQDSNNQNIIYQVAENAGTSTEGNNNTNIIYQVTDSNTGSSTTMSQYMEVLKEAGLPSDVPILLESSDGSYVTVNEEVLMNIMNGGMIQVSDGSIVGGEGVQFIVQEVQEMNEGQIENATVCTEQGVTPSVATSATTVAESNNAVTETVSMPFQEMQVSEAEKSLHPKAPVSTASISTVKHSTYKPAKGQQSKANAAKSLPPLEVKEAADATPERSNVTSFDESPTKSDTKEEVSVPENMQLEINETEPQPIPEPPTQSDEIITGDNYGEEAMEGFAVMEAKESAQNKKMELTGEEAMEGFAVMEAKESAQNKKMELTGEETMEGFAVMEAKESAQNKKMELTGEETVEGFAVMEAKESAQNKKMELTESDTSDFAYPEQTSSNETDEKSFPPNRESVKELKAEDAPASGNMSVEQALQAMMGESSDTEMEVCANTDADGTTKIKPIISHRDTKGHSTPNEGSIDEETEDLRLVLSPEDDSIKVEDESQSAGEGSLNDSFTLALSSPDSTGNEKNNLDADNVTESTEDSQQLEIKPVQADVVPTDLTEAKTVEAINEKRAKYPSDALLTCESNSTAATSFNEISESVSGEMSTDSSSLDVRTVESIKQTTAVEQSDNKALLKGTEPVSLVTTDDTYSQKVEGSKTEGVLVDTSFVSDEPANIQTEHEDVTKEKHPDTEEPAEPIVTDNLVTESNSGKCVLPESGVEFQVDAACSNDTENTKFQSILPTYESNAIAEDDTVTFADNSKTTSKIIPEEELKTAVSELSQNDVDKETSSSLSDAVTNDNEKEILKNMNSEYVPVLNETNIKELVQNEEMIATGERGDTQVENQENEQLEASNTTADEVDVGSEGDVVISPSKDIPYAVGLLPLKTALEKLQAMPEYQPRKTRSASSSKELTSEVPASRLKRKSSSTAEGSEKKLKSDDGDCSVENENNIAVAAEELEECGEENVTSESCGMEVTSNVTMESSVHEEPMHTGEIENTVESLPSVMELVSDSSETV